MPTAAATWQEKAERLRESRGISIPALAKRLRRSERTVRSWLRRTRKPLREAGIVQEVAVALAVPPSWLLNGLDDEPPPRAAAKAIPENLVESVPERFRPLVYALADPDCAQWLLEQLALFRRARGPRGSGR